ncbi:hypothetical protein QFC20_006959 [Naganishia adeliensis]|uniref:Uncharacterized protein n=1 Tax=Naganishia adeliensis TaxID=92952 RepID=A0ACC2V547_9TREE|nr:hypothetical protein QFC20_006959 [Naganishia adeliensis]
MSAAPETKQGPVTPSPNGTSESPYDLSVAHHQKSTTVSPIYGFLLSKLEPQPSTIRGTSISHLTLEPQHLNSAGSIHGSVSATIVDWASGNALATMQSKSGASVDMHVTFLNKAKEGELIEIRGYSGQVRQQVGVHEGRGEEDTAWGVGSHGDTHKVRRIVG